MLEDARTCDSCRFPVRATEGPDDANLHWECIIVADVMTRARNLSGHLGADDELAATIAEMLWEFEKRQVFDDLTSSD